ncbi:MAG: hypothetical protein ACE1Z9_03930, partial [Acidimicrobiia bacterium]
MIHITLSGDIFLKSRRTQPRMIKRVVANLTEALHSVGYDGPFERLGSHRFAISPDQHVDAVVDAATRVFGTASIDTVEEVPAEDLDTLAAGIAARSADRVR